MANRTSEQADLTHTMPTKRARKNITLTGVLQGLGCRPTIYRLATSVGVGGWVVNTSSGVRMEIEGTPEQCSRFMEKLHRGIPFPGRIDRETVHDVLPLGEVSFRIQASLESDRSITPIPPDVAICRECIREMLDPVDRRYLYPFTTCTLCGPRFTVVRSFPYDRERTSMADFVMCSECRAEYESPLDRRFHSQTNSCGLCGPTLTLTNAVGEPLEGDPIVRAAAMLAEGAILGIKGIGGFHIACDALNERAVGLLRARKGRAEKPFAVMVPDVATARRYCTVSPPEEELLTSPVAPIVLLEARGDSPAPSVAPFVGTLGVMLSYTPVHHLLFRHPEIPVADRLTMLVMTSGNRSEEPIARGNEEALERLRNLVDGLLFHDREIVLAADDSIFRVIARRPVVFRRSRGIVPGGLMMPQSACEADPVPGRECMSEGDEESSTPSGPVILAAGGDLKNVLALITGLQVVPGPHVGDLASPIAHDYFKQSAKALADYLEVEPQIVAVDPHPEYFSNTLARELNVPVEEVFHHHAHAVSLLFEHGIGGPAVFAVFDGTGYGPDGTIWGGEFLLADLERFERLGHIGRFVLPGGEAAIRQPVRVLAGLLAQAKGGVIPERFFSLLGVHANQARFWLEAAARGLNSPVTSSAGRLFDAAAAAAGFTEIVTFEGQAAMWLEGIAGSGEEAKYPVRLLSREPLVIDPASLIANVAQDSLETGPDVVSARFHNTVAQLIADSLKQLSRRTGIGTVGLTGGCFQNRLLTERALSLLEAEGLTVLCHGKVPPNDGGIAVGQAVSTWARLKARGDPARD